MVQQLSNKKWPGIRPKKQWWALLGIALAGSVFLASCSNDTFSKLNEGGPGSSPASIPSEEQVAGEEVESGSTTGQVTQEEETQETEAKEDDQGSEASDDSGDGSANSEDDTSESQYTATQPVQGELVVTQDGGLAVQTPDNQTITVSSQAQLAQEDGQWTLVDGSGSAITTAEGNPMALPELLTDSSGNVLVSDGNGSVQLYSPDGQVVTESGEASLSFNSNGQAIVVDTNGDTLFALGDDRRLRYTNGHFIIVNGANEPIAGADGQGILLKGDNISPVDGSNFLVQTDTGLAIISGAGSAGTASAVTRLALGASGNPVVVAGDQVIAELSSGNRLVATDSGYVLVDGAGDPVLVNNRAVTLQSDQVTTQGDNFIIYNGSGVPVAVQADGTRVSLTEKYRLSVDSRGGLVVVDGQGRQVAQIGPGQSAIGQTGDGQYVVIDAATGEAVTVDGGYAALDRQTAQFLSRDTVALVDEQGNYQFYRHNGQGVELTPNASLGVKGGQEGGFEVFVQDGSGASYALSDGAALKPAGEAGYVLVDQNGNVVTHASGNPVVVAGDDPLFAAQDAQGQKWLVTSSGQVLTANATEISLNESDQVIFLDSNGALLHTMQSGEQLVATGSGDYLLVDSEGRPVLTDSGQPVYLEQDQVRYNNGEFTFASSQDEVVTISRSGEILTRGDPYKPRYTLAVPEGSRWFETPEQDLPESSTPEFQNKRSMLQRVMALLKQWRQRHLELISRMKARDGFLGGFFGGLGSWFSGVQGPRGLQQKIHKLEKQKAELQGEVGTGDSRQSGLHTYWSDHPLHLNVADAPTAGWYNLCIKAKNYSATRLPKNYDFFNVAVGNGDRGYGGVQIPASDKVYHRGCTGVYLKEGAARLVLNWTNDAYKPNKYDANIQIKNVTLSYMEEQPEVDPTLRTASQYSETEGRWFWDEESVRTYWDNQVIKFRYDDLEAGRYKLVVTAKNYGKLPRKYQKFDIAVAADGLDQEMSVPAAESYREGSTYLDLTGGDTEISLKWLNDRWLPGVADANLQIKQIRLKRVGDSHRSAVGAFLLGALQGRQWQAFWLFSLVGLLVLFGLAFYVQRRYHRRGGTA